MNEQPVRPLPKKLTPWMGYLNQLFFLTILPLTLLLLVLVFGSLALHQQAMRDMAGEQSLRAVRAAAGQLGEQVSQRIDDLRGLALRIEAGQDPQQALDSSAYLAPDFDAGLVVLHEDGRLEAQTGLLVPEDALRGLIPGSTGEEDAGAGPAWLTLQPETQDPVITLVVPAGQNLYVAGSFFPRLVAAQLLTGTYGSHSASQHVSISLVDPSGTDLYSSGLHNLEAPLERPGVAQALRGESGILFQELGGDEHVAAYSVVEPPGWGLVIDEPWEMSPSPLLRSTQVAPLVLVPVLLLALGGLWLGLRQVIQPLQNLKNQANELAWGRFDAIQQPVGGIEEIHSLQVSLREMASKVQAAQANLHSYIGAITAGQEEERRRLAREIHDDTLQAVIALNQRVQLIRLNLTDPAASASLAEVQGLTDETIQNLRRILRALRPAYLEELGLVASLEILAREASREAGIPITFQCVGVERRLAPEVELAVYRIAQEGTSNLARHARAAQGWLDVHFTPGWFELGIRDDGAGFQVPENPGAFAPLGHFGLLGMRERAELAGAEFRITSGVGQGTSLKLRVPTPGEGE